MIKLLLAILLLFLGEVSLLKAQSGIYVGGHFRRERNHTINDLKASGFTYVILFNVNVETNGDLTVDGETICKNGVYVFGATSPNYVNDVTALKQGVTSINRVEFCIGGWGNHSYANIRSLINAQGTGTGSILYRNFKALKNAIPSVDAINNDDEEAYDVNSATSFHVMMSDIGYKTTLAPYMNRNYWQNLATNVNNKRGGAVDKIYLQWYEGGAGNNPCDWRLNNIEMHTGDLYYENGTNANNKMTSAKNNCGAKGGFFWVYNDNNINLKNLASRVNTIYNVKTKNMQGIANLFNDCNYLGFANGLGVGNYTISNLQASGIANNVISSLTVANGFEVVLYDGNNFDGASKVYRGNVGCLVADGWNDRVGSLRVRAIPADGTGNGLRANYFNGINFETPVYTRVDNSINFNWNSGSPNSSVNADKFSVRWTGLIQPRYSGEYTFYINSDNGRRVWINNKLIIDKWIDDWNIDYIGKITLTAGQKYEIKVEYFENNGGAACKLEWASASQSREVIPASQLYANTLPTVSITSPANNASFNAPASIVIKATAADAGGSIAKVEFYNGSTKLGEDASAPFTYNWNNVKAGNYNITTHAIDNRGGISISSLVAVKVISSSVNQAPTVSISSPTNNSNYNAPASINISANASDADGNVTKVEFYNGTTKLGEDASSPYTFTWSNIPVGTYTISAKAFDNSNANTTSASVTVKVNTVVINKAPNVSITSPTNNATYNAPASIVINANASDADGNVTKVEFYNGGAKLGEDASAPYSYTWSGVAAGTYTISAKAFDNSGASKTSGSVTVKVNTVIVSNPCTGIASYIENSGYVAGSTVQNAGAKYQCKPFPYSGWCNGAAWAYGPGTGAYWTDAWTLIGSCNARLSNEDYDKEKTYSILSPNPTSGLLTLQLAYSSNVSIFNTYGTEVIPSTPINFNGTIDLTSLSAGVYIVRIENSFESITQSIVKK